jgi:transcriptional regulator with XRE-family HTH domain
MVMKEEQFRKILFLVSQLKSIRQSKKISLKELASKSGIGIATLVRLENNKTTEPELTTLFRYANALNINLDLRISDA